MDQHSGTAGSCVITDKVAAGQCPQRPTIPLVHAEEGLLVCVGGHDPAVRPREQVDLGELNVLL